MRLVIIESPYAGDTDRNIWYARRAVHDSLMKGEAPLASHLLYTQPLVLDDLNLSQRALGITAGHAWMKFAETVAVYNDYGTSKGMEQGIALAELLGIKIEFRLIGKNAQ